ncbi:MAG TPA: helix-turn-helix domain-containing protein [Thermoplasmata archaeon]|nr:helix-turn-helix domain-containing protein [Thermoplasmata archaeon]
MPEVRTQANTLLEDAARSSSEKIAATLRELGLRGYAADAFCALVRLPEATAGALVAKTGIPDSKVYYALDELAERGLVAVQAGKPKTYRAVPSRDVASHLDRMLDEKHGRERSAVARVAALIEPLQAAAKTPATELAYVVKGLANVLARAQAMVAAARREVVVLASQERFFRKLEPELAKLARRRVRLKLAVPKIALDKDLARIAEIRAIACDCLILVVDRQQVLTVSGADTESPYGITSTDETLVRLGLEYWESPRCCVPG